MIFSSSSTMSSSATGQSYSHDIPPPSYEAVMAEDALLGSHRVQSTFADTAVNTNYQTTTRDLPGTSQQMNVDLHNAFGLDNPVAYGASAKPLDLYSVSDHDDLQLKIKNAKIDLIHLVKDNLFALPFFDVVTIPGCGRLDSVRFLHVMLSLCESSYQYAFPKTIIGIGSGEAFLEKCFGLMGGVNVKCHDREPLNRFLPVEQAEFPKDIGKCLLDDCSSCALVSGYPQGYLGPVLAEFIRRGGEMLCTTVESGLLCDMHGGYEDNPDLLREGIEALKKKSGECFEVKLTEYTMMGPPSYIQFYNWPSSVKQLMFDSPDLKDLCSDIEFFDNNSDESD